MWICAGPGLVLVQSLPTFIERPDAGDAHAGQFQRFAHRTQQDLGYRGKSTIRRPLARRKAERATGWLQRRGGRRRTARRPRNVVLAQAEQLFDIEFGHPGGKGLRANETPGARVVVPGPSHAVQRERALCDARPCQFVEKMRLPQVTKRVISATNSCASARSSSQGLARPTMAGQRPSKPCTCRTLSTHKCNRWQRIRPVGAASSTSTGHRCC